MTTAQTQSIISQTTDAEFRSWGSDVNTQLTAVGLVQTSDTGQVNWTTVTKPAGTSASQGYEIWRYNDTLQSTVPIFLKLEYGSNANAATTPGMWLTIGTGSNGAGTITGIVQARTLITVNSGLVSNTTPYVSQFCYNNTYGFLLANVKKQSVAYSVATIVIGRSVDQSTGLPTNIGFWWFYVNGANPIGGSYTAATGVSLSDNVARWTSTFGSNQAMLNNGAAIVYRSSFTFPQNLMTSQLLIGVAANFPDNTQISLSPFGTSLNYIAIVPSTSNVSWSSSAVVGFVPLLLWQ